MFCGQCGKKIMENMLFCPFCGSPILIPDQDVEPAVASKEERAAEVSAAGKPAEVRPTEEARQTEEARPAAEARPTEETRPAAEVRPTVETRPATEVCSNANVSPAEVPHPAVQETAAQKAVMTGAAEERKRPVSLFDNLPPEEPRREEPFVPLSFDESPSPEREKEEEIEIVSAKVEIEEKHPRGLSRRPEPQELRRTESARRRASQTFIPVRDVDLDDIFMDGGSDEDDYDDYDLDDDGDYRDDFDFEEPEHGGFFQRHIRGLVGLALLVILLVICTVWAFSAKGQRTLAKANLAWTAQPYADLGYEAYRQDSDLLAARYYEKALARDETNYEYAHSAMVAYYEAEDIPSAAAMLKKCIAMNPDSPEPYQELMILYPDAETRPWEVQELLRQGYERTGSAALKQD